MSETHTSCVTVGMSGHVALSLCTTLVRSHLEYRNVISWPLHTLNWPTIEHACTEPESDCQTGLIQPKTSIQEPRLLTLRIRFIMHGDTWTQSSDTIGYSVISMIWTVLNHCVLMNSCNWLKMLTRGKRY